VDKTGEDPAGAVNMELDMDWIHPWIGLDWIGLGQDFEETVDWIGLGPMTQSSVFFIYIFSTLTTEKR